MGDKGAFTRKRALVPATALAGFQKAYDDLKYAPARRVGDVLYISGVVAGRLANRPAMRPRSPARSAAHSG